MSENWRQIPDFPDYEVSDQGNVRSVAGEPISPFVTDRGYVLTRVRLDGARFTRRVHVLVAAAFIGPRPTGAIIRHLDGNPANNTPANLRYGTVSENAYDRVRHGRDVNVNKTHCPVGHEYTPENTYLPPSRLWRQCRACRNEAARLYREARKAVA